MADFPVILFPHSHITCPDLRKTLDLFGRLTICQPWFIDIPLPAAEKQDLSHINIIRPPSHLKPKSDIKGLLSEYKLWIRNNQDRGYTASLKVGSETPFSDENMSWEIRRMINQTGEGFSPPLDGNTLKWHTLLHLTWELEKNIADAAELLENVKRQKPPLEDILEHPASSHGFFDDLSEPEMYPFPDSHLLELIIEAWVALFGEYLQNDALLITFDRQIMNCVIKIFEDKSSQSFLDNEPCFPPELTSTQANFTLKYLPQIPDNSDKNSNPVLTCLSGKTIIMLED